MLAKRHHLPVQLLIDRRPVRLLRHEGVSLKLFSSNVPYGRLGVIIPKAAVAKATERNKLKRAAFDAFYPLKDSLTYKDVLCVVSKKKNWTRDGMLNEVGALLSKLTP